MASVEAGHVSVWRIAKHTREFAADDINGGVAAAVGGAELRAGRGQVLRRGYRSDGGCVRRRVLL